MPGILVAVGEAAESMPAVTHRSLRPLQVARASGPGWFVERYVNDKFLKDKVFHDDPACLIAMDGVVLNFEDLRRARDCGTAAETIKKMYDTDGDTFFNSFRGEFSGAFYDKQSRKWLIFTNHCGTKPIFYYYDDGLLVCASELKVVTQLLRKLSRPYTLDPVGAYLLLTFGFMLEDYTLVREIKKLKAGHCLEIGDQGIRVRRYHQFENEPPWPSPKAQIIDGLEERFREAVRLEYQKDADYGYRHIAALSGGLDSRMSMMVARELGFTDILNINFGQSHCPDVTIAQRIAADVGNEFLFYALDNGTFLRNAFHRAITANDGLVIWAGAAHELTMLGLLDYGPYGLLHTGQVGDAVMGSFLSEPRMKKPALDQGAYSKTLLGKIRDTLVQCTELYDSEEMFLFYNRGFNGAINGNWMTYQFTESGSAFLNVDFLEYALRIPPALRFHEAIYQEWVLQRHPAVARYVWDKIKTRLGTGRLRRFIRREVVNRILWHISQRRFPGSMNPFSYWYSTNANLRSFLDGYLDQNVGILGGQPELMGDCRTLFREGSVLEKCQVMTLCEAVRLHFPS